MRTIDDIRHERLLELIREAGSIQALADRLEKSHSQISQLKTRAKYPNGTRKTIGTSLAREIEHKCDKPEGWMDSDPSVCCTGSPAEYRELPARRESAVVVNSQAVWRGAASRLVEYCKAERLFLDPETFMEAVDAAVGLAGEDIEAAERVYRHLMPVIAKRAIGHAAT